MHRHERLRSVLYLGTDPTFFLRQGWDFDRFVHYPVIKVVPRPLGEVREAFMALPTVSHLLFTSKNAVAPFFAHLHALQLSMEGKSLIALGASTAYHLEKQGKKADIIPEEESQEGLLAHLSTLALERAHIFLPRSSLSRPLLTQELSARAIQMTICDLYDTLPQKLEPVPPLHWFDTIIFTSPSTVEAFLAIFGTLPEGKRLLAQGRMTREALEKATAQSVTSCATTHE